MAENTRHSDTRSPVDNVESSKPAQAFLESQLGEYYRIKKMIRFVSISDELETLVANAIENILVDEPKLDESNLMMSEVTDIIHGFPPVETLLKPEFFLRTTLPFRLLRRCSEMHLVNPVKDESKSEVDFLDEEREDPRLAEQVWFLLFLGASPSAVTEMLSQSREFRTLPSSPSANSFGKDNYSQVRPKPSNMYGNLRCPQRELYQPSGSPRTNQNLFPVTPTKSYGLEQKLPSVNNDGQSNVPNNNRLSNSNQQQDDRATTSQVRTHHSSDFSYVQSKKGRAVESYFRDRKFTGAPEQSINNLIRDFEVCAVQQCLDKSKMSLFFVNDLVDPARQFFLTHCFSRMQFDEIIAHMRRRYESDTRQLQLQSEMDSLSLPSFMHKRRITEITSGLAMLVDYINALAPQLPRGFGDDAHKTRYLLRAVMSYDWAQQPISQLTTSRYTFVQLITALNESLQLLDEISRARTTDIQYRQYFRDHRDVRKQRNGRQDQRGWSPRRHQFPHLNDYNNRYPHISYGRQRSQSPAFGNRPRRNPCIPQKRVCWGCGSPDHLLRDKKCTPTLDTIKTNIVPCFQYSNEDASMLAEEFSTLFSHPHEIQANTTHHQ